MDINTKPGKKIKYNLPGNGEKEDKTSAAEYLMVNRIYTIKEIFAGDYRTEIRLKEHPNLTFNSVLFSNL